MGEPGEHSHPPKKEDRSCPKAERRTRASNGDEFDQFYSPPLPEKSAKSGSNCAEGWIGVPISPGRIPCDADGQCSRGQIMRGPSADAHTAGTGASHSGGISSRRRYCHPKDPHAATAGPASVNALNPRSASTHPIALGFPPAPHADGTSCLGKGRVLSRVLRKP